MLPNATQLELAEMSLKQFTGSSAPADKKKIYTSYSNRPFNDNNGGNGRGNRGKNKRKGGQNGQKGPNQKNDNTGNGSGGKKSKPNKEFKFCIVHGGKSSHTSEECREVAKAGGVENYQRQQQNGGASSSN